MPGTAGTPAADYGRGSPVSQYLPQVSPEQFSKLVGEAPRQNWWDSWGSNNRDGRECDAKNPPLGLCQPGGVRAHRTSPERPLTGLLEGCTSWEVLWELMSSGRGATTA